MGGNFDPQPTIDFWDKVNREDWRVSELTQKGMARPRLYSRALFKP